MRSIASYKIFNISSQCEEEFLITPITYYDYKALVKTLLSGSTHACAIFYRDLLQKYVLDRNIDEIHPFTQIGLLLSLRDISISTETTFLVNSKEFKYNTSELIIGLNHILHEISLYYTKNPKELSNSTLNLRDILDSGNISTYSVSNFKKRTGILQIVSTIPLITIEDQDIFIDLFNISEFLTQMLSTSPIDFYETEVELLKKFKYTIPPDISVLDLNIFIKLLQKTTEKQSSTDVSIPSPYESL